MKYNQTNLKFIDNLRRMLMKIDENKTMAELAIQEAINIGDTLNAAIEPTWKYLLAQLDIDLAGRSENDMQLLLNNFVHLMCVIIRDIREINDRLVRYHEAYKKAENNNSNSMEYHRKKIKYFCTINEDARTTILEFLHYRLKDYLIENDFDTLQVEQKGNGLCSLFLKRRYMFAQFPEYYDMDFEFPTVAKVSYLPGIKPLEMMSAEKEYLSLYRTDKNKYIKKMHNIVDKENLIDCILRQVNENFHLHKRREIFLDLKKLFSEAHYQSFVSLGLLQLEGLFYDLCQIKYGAKENAGTLIEKVEKSLQGRNEFSFMRYYPYFAFDIPIQRNEIAHKGMLESVNIKNVAYDLVLDLNTVVAMVKSESYDKFIVFIMTHEKMLEIEANKQESTTAAALSDSYRCLIEELIQNSLIASEYFWKVLKRPEDYSEELEFYKPDALLDGYIDLWGIVKIISLMIRDDGFWEELLDMIQKTTNQFGNIPKDLYSFSKRMKDDFISELDGDAKNYCIEISKLLKNSSNKEVYCEL